MLPCLPLLCIASSAASPCGASAHGSSQPRSAGVPVWRAVGSALAGCAMSGRLHADVAPFGVGYLVADWAPR